MRTLFKQHMTHQFMYNIGYKSYAYMETAAHTNNRQVRFIALNTISLS